MSVADETQIYLGENEIKCIGKYNGYKIYYQRPNIQSVKSSSISDGYQNYQNEIKENAESGRSKIGSFFAVPSNGKLEYSEMIVRQNMNNKLFKNENENLKDTLQEFYKLIDECEGIQTSIFMPILPATKKTGIDYQHLEKEAVLPSTSEYGGMQKQIINAFERARFNIVKLTQKAVPEKWVLYGGDKETSKGLIRLWSLCPEKTSAVYVVDGIENVVLPVETKGKETLNFPEGFADYEEITGKAGNSREVLEEYRNTRVQCIGNNEKDKQKEKLLKRLKFKDLSVQVPDGSKTIIGFKSFYQQEAIDIKFNPINFLKNLFSKQEPIQCLPEGRGEIKSGLQNMQLAGRELDNYNKTAEIAIARLRRQSRRKGNIQEKGEAIAK